MLSAFLSTLLILDAFILIILIIVLQHGNEGGFGGAFGGGNTSGFFGASGGVGFIIKATWVCGTLFFLLAGASAWVKTHNTYGVRNEIEKSLTQELLEKSAQPTQQESLKTKPSEPLSVGLESSSQPEKGSQPEGSSQPLETMEKGPESPKKGLESK
jgi:preprotein translocase subunit SecG